MRSLFLFIAGLLATFAAVLAGGSSLPSPLLRPLPAAGCAVACAAALWCTRYLLRAGLLTGVTVSEKEFSECKYAYKTHTSAYKDCGQHFDAVCKIASQHAPDCLPIGIYMDDPKAVPHDKTRYAVGVRVPPDAPALEHALKSAGYTITDLPRTPAIHATFPFTSILSIIIGVMRVYPKMEAYCAETNTCAAPYVEVCIGREQLTHYYGMLDNRKAFYLGLSDPDTYASQNPRDPKKAQ